MYSYFDMLSDIDKLPNNVIRGVFGKTHLNNDLFFLFVGASPFSQSSFCSSENADFFERKHFAKNTSLIVSGGIHAREFASSRLVVLQAKYAAEHFNELSKEDKHGGIFFLPMINPDGNLVATQGLKAIPAAFHNSIKKMSEGNSLKLWKANIRGVDLNTNFDAKFGLGKNNIRHPSYQNFVGMYPFSEKETAALSAFTRATSPKATISYHALGREIYWDFNQKGELRETTLALAKKAEEFTNYKIISGTGSSSGGYKDWCLDRLGIPSLTIELGSDSLSHPADISEFKQDFKLNLPLPLAILKMLL